MKIDYMDLTYIQNKHLPEGWTIVTPSVTELYVFQYTLKKNGVKIATIFNNPARYNTIIDTPVPEAIPLVINVIEIALKNIQDEKQKEIDKEIQTIKTVLGIS